MPCYRARQDFADGPHTRLLKSFRDGPHILTSSKSLYITRVRGNQRTQAFCAYASFIHEAPGASQYVASYIFRITSTAHIELQTAFISISLTLKLCIRFITCPILNPYPTRIYIRNEGITVPVVSVCNTAAQYRSSGCICSLRSVHKNDERV